MFGNPYQWKVYNANDLEMCIKENNGINPCFISVCQFDPDPYLEYVPFDFDGPNAKKDAQKLVAFFDKNNLNPYIVVFSGLGYHVYLKVVKHYYSKSVLASFQNDIIGGLNLTTADSCIIGDIRRVMRIPNTINEKHGTVCQYIYNDHQLDNPVLDLLLWTNNNSKREREFNINREFESLESNDNNLISELHSYPCLKYWIRSEEPPHLIRVWYVTYKLIEGYSVDDIIDDLRSYNWVDWDENLTRYQIHHIVNKGYKMPKCKTIMDHGFCIKHKYEGCNGTNTSN
jgi:hypothetical protein